MGGKNVSAHCKCGYKKKISVGGDMSTYKYFSYFPFYCGKCEDITSLNLHIKADIERFFPSLHASNEDGRHTRLKCSDCSNEDVIPYSDESLVGDIGKYTIVHSSGHSLTSGNYKCPKCKEMKLHFMSLNISLTD